MKCEVLHCSSLSECVPELVLQCCEIKESEVKDKQAALGRKGRNYISANKRFRFNVSITQIFQVQ